MYGNRNLGRFDGGQQSILGNANMLMANQMGGLMAQPNNMQMLNRGGGRQDSFVGGGLFPGAGPLGMQQRPGMGFNSVMNAPMNRQDPVIDILPHRSAAGGTRRGGNMDRKGQTRPAFSPPAKRNRPNVMSLDDLDSGASDSRNGAKSRFNCRVCRIKFASIDEFDEHMCSEGHAANMKVMSAVYYDKNQELLTTSQSRDVRRMPSPPSRAGSGVCPVCDRTYGRYSEFEHKQSKQHKHRAYLVKKGCVLCGVKGFVNYTMYVSHIDSAAHKEKKRDLKDSAATAPTTAKSPQPPRSPLSKTPAAKESVGVEKVEEEKGSNVDDFPTQSETASTPSDLPLLESAAMDEDDFSDDFVYNPDVAIGVEHVISVTGYFCKLCHKFYNNEMMARISHCKSRPHFDKYLEHQRVKSSGQVQSFIKPSASVAKVSTAD